MSSSLYRVLRNAWEVGPRSYWKQLNSIGDTKSGHLVGKDIYGNKFYETTHQDEIHLRTRWVEYKEKDYDMSQVEPGWHFWLGYGVDTAPCNTPKDKLPIRAYPYKFQPNYTGTPGSFVTYNTIKPKISAWEPVAKARS
ncbi:NADH dehydrogenase [ubiquinone] 1 alpha subcomplex subunit N7BM [Yarrowia sp. B02]|nr:NADH dehydrogenase [ubiquinone] 1 alpha subcomplex subunit N7BM [Yarrowia sp. B02]